MSNQCSGACQGFLQAQSPGCPLMGFPHCSEGLTRLVALTCALWGAEDYGQELMWDPTIPSYSEVFCLAPPPTLSMKVVSGRLSML